VYIHLYIFLDRCYIIHTYMYILIADKHHLPLAGSWLMSIGARFRARPVYMLHQISPPLQTNSNAGRASQNTKANMFLVKMSRPVHLGGGAACATYTLLNQFKTAFGSSGARRRLGHRRVHSSISTC